MLPGNRSLEEILWGEARGGRSTARVDPTVLRNGLQSVYVVVAALVIPAECLTFHTYFYLLFVKKYGIMNVR